MTTIDKSRAQPWVLAGMLGLLLTVAPLAAHAQVQVPVKIYAQELVDRTVAQHPDLRAVVMHVTPPNAADNVIIASSIGRIGKPADADDREVLATGKTRVEMDRRRWSTRRCCAIPRSRSWRCAAAIAPRTS